MRVTRCSLGTDRSTDGGERGLRLFTLGPARQTAAALGSLGARLLTAMKTIVEHQKLLALPYLSNAAPAPSAGPTPRRDAWRSIIAPENTPKFLSPKCRHEAK